MSHPPFEYDDNEKVFKFSTAPPNQLSKLEEFFRAYQALQHQLSLKFPMGQHFRVAKIMDIQKKDCQLWIKFYYEGNQGLKYQVYIGLQQFQRALPLTRNFQDKYKMDVPAIKSVFQSLIEVFHWSANFGLFLDPNYENLLYKEIEGDFYLLIPSFFHITNYIYNKGQVCLKFFNEFRIKDFQNITFIFLLRVVKEFFELIKQQDEDINLYKTIQQRYNYPKELDQIDPYTFAETCFGVDFMYSEDLVKKKMIRYGLKQTQFLYQLNKNEVLKNSLQIYLKKEKQILEKSSVEEPDDQNTLSGNTYQFFKQLKGKPLQGISNDIFTPFLKALVESKDDVQIVIRRNWKKISTKHDIDIIDQNKQQDQTKSQVQTNQEQSNSKTFDIKWFSQVNPQNQIYIPISQSGQQIEQSVKKFAITYKIEMLEDKNCYLIKTQVPEMLFGIDTADDIAYFVNSLQKEKLSTNVYVDDTRKVTFYTALVQGSPGPILWDIIKILDIHQIYFYHSLDFYFKNISQGKQIKDVKYSSFLTELKNLLKDYEYDSKRITSNLLDNQIIEDGF